MTLAQERCPEFGNFRDIKNLALCLIEERRDYLKIWTPMSFSLCKRRMSVDFLCAQYNALMGIVWKESMASHSGLLRVRNCSIDELGYRVLKLHEARHRRRRRREKVPPKFRQSYGRGDSVDVGLHRVPTTRSCRFGDWLFSCKFLWAGGQNCNHLANQPSGIWMKEGFAIVHRQLMSQVL